MLQKWVIENFKSINRRVEIDLAPLTIFAGANSSGKSTVLQSIILAKQTIQYAPHSRSVALNGPMLKLGRFDDVRHEGSESNSIGFGATFNLKYQPPVAAVGNLAEVGMYYRRLTDEFDTLSFQADFHTIDESELSLLQPTLFHSQVTLWGGENLDDNEHPSHDTSDRHMLYANVGQTNALLSENLLHRSNSPQNHDPRTRSANYEISDADTETTTAPLNEYEAAKIIGVNMLHFLPHSVEIQYDQARTEALSVVDAIANVSPRYNREFESEIPKEIFQNLLNFLSENGVATDTEIFDELTLEMLDHDEDDHISVERVTEVLRGIQRNWDRTSNFIIRKGRNINPLRENRIIPLRVYLEEYRTQLEQELLDFYGSKFVRTQETPRLFRTSTYYIEQFFRQNVDYLGPLRDEPKPLYPLEALANPTDVGYRGEHTAAVLELNRTREVLYIPPNQIDTADVKAFASRATLHDAAVEWLSYLGVADDILTADMGKFGHQMQVVTQGTEKKHDLTNVGVGVSQVLPIIIMALLSRESSFLIFEQPELHLHPKVQTRLADFFISLSMQGKQCIIETHSEYLLQRIRRRTAEFSSTEISDLTKIYFVEREKGESKYTSVAMNEFGSISNWPKDFFDQSDSEIEYIIKAATKKNQQK